MPKITANDLSTALLLHADKGGEMRAWLEAQDPNELADLLLERETDDDGEERGFPLQFALIDVTYKGTETFKLLFDRIPRDKLIYALTEPFNGGVMGVKSMVDAYIPYAEGTRGVYGECFDYIRTRLRSEIAKPDCPAEFKKEANRIINKITLYLNPELLPEPVRTIAKAGFTVESALTASPWAFKTLVISHAAKFRDRHGDFIENPASFETMLGAISGTLDPAKIAKQIRTKDEFICLMMPASSVLSGEPTGRSPIAMSYNQARDNFISISLCINRDSASGPVLCGKLEAWLKANDLWLTDNPDDEADWLFTDEGILYVYIPLDSVAKFSSFLEELKELKVLPKLAEDLSKKVIDAINTRNAHRAVATAGAGAAAAGGGAGSTAAAGGAGASSDGDAPTFTP